jgi:hypothetical protein
MTIIYFDHTDTPCDQLKTIARVVSKKLPDCLFLPKSFEVLQECSEETLLGAKAMIEEALQKKQEESC